MEYIAELLENHDFSDNPQYDLDQDKIEHQVLRRIYSLLSLHELKFRETKKKASN